MWETLEGMVREKAQEQGSSETRRRCWWCWAAMRDGTKEVLALRSGYRESVESCSEVLRDLKARGIEAPRLLMADGNAAIWGGSTAGMA